MDIRRISFHGIRLIYTTQTNERLDVKRRLIMIRMNNNRNYDVVIGTYGLVYNRRTRWISENKYDRWRESI